MIKDMGKMTTFNQLWQNYPRGSDYTSLQARCYNKQEHSSQPFDNYCAIKLSECFVKSGINIASYSGAKCWSTPGTRHLIRAEDLANGLVLFPPSVFGRREKINPHNYQEALSDKTGVIFFKDYWQREINGRLEDMEHRSGDHIDLWNKNETTGEGNLRRSILEFFGAVSDLNLSKEIWFWQVT